MEKPKTADGMTLEGVRKHFPEWFEVKRKVWECYYQYQWFKGVGIGTTGVNVYVFAEEDVAKIPNEIDGVKITKREKHGSKKAKTYKYR